MRHHRDSDETILVRFILMLLLALFPVLIFSAGYYEGQKMRPQMCKQLSHTD